MAGNIDDDEYVANLLQQDARNAKKKYELVGIDAFNPRRLKSGAPKPNTNFLRHIIRQTDSHNSALLAREAEEAKARLKRMNKEKTRAQTFEKIRKERKADGRLTPVLSDADDTYSGPSERRRDSEKRHGRSHSGHSHRERSDPRGRTHRMRSRSRDDERSERKRGHSLERPGQRSKHLELHRSSGHRRRFDEESNSNSEDNQTRKRHKSGHMHKRRRSRSRSTSRTHPRTCHLDQAEDKRSHRNQPPSTSPSRRSHRRHKVPRTSSKSLQRSPTPHSDSDPLEVIVGPLPPNANPSVRSRGRGAHKANSMGMDSRFSSTYNPKIDVRPPSDAEDDWGDAVESFRHRQRFKQQGADRLRAAGFTDEQVRKWEKGDGKDEEDVTWSKRGQAREWDRGKVVDDDGHVDVKAHWGRLV